MLSNVTHDEHLQRYLHHMEQRLHIALFPILRAGMRLHMSRGSIVAHDYVTMRGRLVLLRYYRTIYHDIFDWIPEHVEKARLRPRRFAEFMEELDDVLQTKAAAKIDGISRTDRQRVHETLVEGLSEGRSIEDIAQEIADQVDDISLARAASIARTEAHSAAMEAEWETLQSRGVEVRSKTWRTVGDAKVRESHVNLDGVTIGADELFDGASGPMMFPGDGAHGAGPEDIVNCRCSCIYST